jgi:acetolactate synthase-1/2/3 large subunit
VPRDLQEATLDFAYPDDVDLPGWRPPTKVHPLQIREAARAIAHARKPVLYVGGGTLTATPARSSRGSPRPGRSRS